MPTSGESIGDMAAFDSAMERILSDNAIPGGALAVSYKGKPMLVKSYGYASKNLFSDSIPATPEKRWRIASISKSITSIAILQLVEEGKIQLEDPLLKYFQDLDNRVKLSDERFKKITVRMLLQHRSGLLTDSDDPMTGLSPPCPRKTSRWIESHTLADDPGVKYSYSNMGYCILGHVIESASGVGYEEYVKKMLLKIGATSIRIGKSQDSGIDEVIYYNSPDETRGPYNSFILEDLGSAGGLIATPSDLVKFADHIFGSEKSLLQRKETFFEIITPPTGVADRRFYGLGFNVVLNGQDSATIFHSGSLVGTSSFLAKYSNGWTIAAAFNRRKKDYRNLILNIDRALSNARNQAVPPDSSQELSSKYR